MVARRPTSPATRRRANRQPGDRTFGAHYLGADTLAPRAGQGAVQRDGGIRLIDAMDYPAVEQREQPFGAADRGVERHMPAGGIAVEVDVQVCGPGCGASRLLL